MYDIMYIRYKSVHAGSAYNDDIFIIHVCINDNTVSVIKILELLHDNNLL